MQSTLYTFQKYCKEANKTNYNVGHEAMFNVFHMICKGKDNLEKT
jgi:hypothetical protein